MAKVDTVEENVSWLVCDVLDTFSFLSTCFHTVSNAHLRYSRGSSNVHRFISTFLGRKTHAPHEHHCTLLTIKVPARTTKGFFKDNHPCTAALKNSETIPLIWRACKVKSRTFLISKEQYSQLENPIVGKSNDKKSHWRTFIFERVLWPSLSAVSLTQWHHYDTTSPAGPFQRLTESSCQITAPPLSSD